MNIQKQLCKPDTYSTGRWRFLQTGLDEYCIVRVRCRCEMLGNSWTSFEIENRYKRTASVNNKLPK